ncbi:uncharacterized protein V6R79_009118 [Siganus canaliculatus]
MVLQKLGLWLEAAELIWASLLGYYALPQPDKKGIGTSLGILANILVSMNDEDFLAFKNNPDIDLSLLGDNIINSRLLSAAQAAKMAVVYSQYTSLYVLTNATTQGTCLLSYSFSMACPSSRRQSFLLEAKEAFVIGLLTKADGDLVTSKQELHTFLKAAYSLAVTHKWLGTPQEVVARATEACQKALALFYDYNADGQGKDPLCSQIMALVNQVKLLLKVEPFINSDKKSFIPDSYRNIEDASVSFPSQSFSTVMNRYQKYHKSLCEVTNTNCKGVKAARDGPKLCITALGTTIGTLYNTEPSQVPKDTTKRDDTKQRSAPAAQNDGLRSTVEGTDDLGSSWQKLSLSSSGSPANAGNYCCPTTEVDDDMAISVLQSANENKNFNSSASFRKAQESVRPTYSSSASSCSGKFEVIQADIPTWNAEEDWRTHVDVQVTAQSPSQQHLRTTSSGLSDSFSSHSSWEKISADMNSPTNKKPPPKTKAGNSQSSKPPDADESFFVLETSDCDLSDSPHDPTHKTHTSGWESGAVSSPQPLMSLHIDPNMDTEVDSVSQNLTASLTTPDQNNKHFFRETFASAAPSKESSFELLGENENGKQGGEVNSVESTNAPLRENPLCYNCQRDSDVAALVPEKQYSLSQQDLEALLAGVCHECLLKRFHSDKTTFKLKTLTTAYSGLHLKFSKVTGLWTAKETCVYIGESMDEEGKQRRAIWVQFLHQEERLSSYVGKDYLTPKGIQFHLKDVERQMTAQYYVTEFNKRLYDQDVMAQIFFIPSEALLIMNGDVIVGCVTVEPYMLGDFVKLTNNKEKKNLNWEATEYGLAFGHFTYLFSNCQEVVVDLQGWVAANGKGLTYLTDPQIHSTKTPKGPANFAETGLNIFLKEQHGPECNDICRMLKLSPIVRQ